MIVASLVTWPNSVIWQKCLRALTAQSHFLRTNSVQFFPPSLPRPLPSEVTSANISQFLLLQILPWRMWHLLCNRTYFGFSGFWEWWVAGCKALVAGVKNPEVKSVCCLLIEDSLAFVLFPTCPAWNKEQTKPLEARKVAAHVSDHQSCHKGITTLQKSHVRDRKVHSGETLRVKPQHWLSRVKRHTLCSYDTSRFLWDLTNWVATVNCF